MREEPSADADHPADGLRLIHGQVPGRARFRSSALYRRPELGRALEVRLAAHGSVRRARANGLTGGLLVVFDPDMSHEEVRDRVAGLLEDLGVSLNGGDGEPRALQRRLALHRSGAARAQALVDEVSGRGEQTGRGAREVPDAEAHRPDSEPWHAMEVETIAARWETSPEDGLDPAACAARRRLYGPNALPEVPPRSGLAMIADQVANLPVALLGASAVASLATGGLLDAAVIVGVIAANGVIGYATERGTQRTIKGLYEARRHRATVRRGGASTSLDAAEVVPGDVLLLTPGDWVAADARLVVAERLTIDESALTGESAPVRKDAATLDDEAAPLGDRRDMVFRGTLVTGGSGRAVVVATGPRTRIGAIQGLLSDLRPPETPLQGQLRAMGGQLVLASSLFSLGVFAVGLLRGHSLVDIGRTAISLAVAAVPEGLPTVAVTTLALGVRRMERLGVLARHLGAVETLGAVQVVCFDKTGTITRNRMTVVHVEAGGGTYLLEDGRFRLAGRPVEPLDEPALSRLLQVIALCSEADLAGGGDGAPELRGSPTETALVRAALEAGLDVARLRSEHPVERTVYRTEVRGIMSTVHPVEGDRWLLAVKGRPSDVLDRCRWRLVGGERVPMEESDREVVATDNERMAGDALRVLGVAYREGDSADVAAEDGLTWLGLVGMTDPPRPGMRRVIERFHRAGVRTIMITGDQSATAYAIGQEIGLAREGHLEIVESTRLDALEPDVLRTLAQRAHVFARVSPSHKLAIVRNLQRAGLVVAMTGDGINDGPALKAADIGAAMGGAGTEAAREVADVILREDDLEALVTALEQGRVIHDDIHKAVHFILATNLSEMLVTFTTVAAGIGQPLTPLRLLWINLLTDIFPELALAVEPPEPDVLDRPPRDPDAPLFTRRQLGGVAAEGGVLTAGALAAYGLSMLRDGDAGRAGTIAFTGLTSAQLLHALTVRSRSRRGSEEDGREAGPWLPLAVGGGVALQVAAALFPPLRRVLGLSRLGLVDWGITAAAAGGPFLVHELWAAARDRRSEASKEPPGAEGVPLRGPEEE